MIRIEGMAFNVRVLIIITVVVIILLIIAFLDDNHVQFSQSYEPQQIL